MQLTKKKKAGIVLVSVLCCGLALFSFRSNDDNYFEVSRNIDIFITLFRELNIYYVEETDPAMLVQRGIDSMLAGLDPYTQFIPETDLEDYRAMTTGQYGGLRSRIIPLMSFFFFRFSNAVLTS